MLNRDDLKTLRYFFVGGFFNPLKQIVTVSLREFLPAYGVFNPRYAEQQANLSKVHNVALSTVTRIHNVNKSTLSTIHHVNF